MIFHANCPAEVIDLVQTQLPVQMEEYHSVPDGQVLMSLQVPDVEQIFIVQQIQSIPG